MSDLPIDVQKYIQKYKIAKFIEDTNCISANTIA
jgi:hypothetical protein